MADVIFILLLVAFFAVAAAVVIACDRALTRRADAVDEIASGAGPRDPA